jgi:hypothetical protein
LRSRPPAADGESEGREAISTPYEIDVRVWRDEQPGNGPRLHLSATFAPREGTWSEVALASLELRAGDRSWTPERSALRALPGGGFEIRAEGAATIAPRVTVVPLAVLNTAIGARQVRLPECIVRVVR